MEELGAAPCAAPSGARHGRWSLEAPVAENTPMSLRSILPDALAAGRERN
jgi:hypothetical protein